MIKAFLPLMSAALLLSSCSAWRQDNKANNHQTENITLSPVSQAYDGYEELLGKEYKNFKLPERITVSEFQNVYTLDCIVEKHDYPNEYYDRAGEIVKEYYGDEYDESVANINDIGLVYEVGEKDSSYHGGDLYLRASDYMYLESGSAIYSTVATQGDSCFSFGGNEVKVSDEAKIIDDYLNDLISPMYEDYKIETKYIIVDASSGNNVIIFKCSENFEGIPFQYDISEYSKTDSMGNMIYWAFSGINGYLDSSGRFTFILASVPFTIVEKSQQESIISFSDAVKLIENELAENSFYNFANVEIMYCYLTEQPQIGLGLSEEENEKVEEEYHKRIRTFEPMWCFEIEPDENTQVKKYVKVNATTGEIFMDVE